MSKPWRTRLEDLYESPGGKFLSRKEREDLKSIIKSACAETRRKTLDTWRFSKLGSLRPVNHLEDFEE
jgi:hypothetical protein